MAFRVRLGTMFLSLKVRNYRLFAGTAPFGSLLTGWLSERYGPRTAIWSGGVLSVLAATLILAWQLRHSGDRIAMRLRPWPRIHVVEESPTLTANAPFGA